jgi:hypothetical protein
MVARGAERKQGSRRRPTLGRRGGARRVERTRARSGQGTSRRARALPARRFPGGARCELPGSPRAMRLLYARGFPGDIVRRAVGDASTSTS